VGLADDLENLEDLHRSGALSSEEYTGAKRRLLAGAQTSAPRKNSTESAAAETPHRGTQHAWWSRRPVLVGAAAGAVLVVLGVGLGSVLIDGRPGGRDADQVQQRSDAQCQEISDDLMAQNKPMAEVYPTLRGMGCGRWLDEKFQDNADTP
jgi:hypothetical protein